MKAGEYIIKKSLVLSLLVMYVFMLSTYMVFLPKYTAGPKIAAALTTVYLQRNNSESNLYIQVHSFKTIIENKRKSISFLVKTASLVFLLIFFGTALPVLIRKTGTSLNIFAYPQQRYYLSFCVLRI